MRDAEGVRRGRGDRGRLVARRSAARGVKTLLQALAERSIGRRDQAHRVAVGGSPSTRAMCTRSTRCSGWPETKRLLGLLVNSSGGAQRAQRAAAWCRPFAQAGPPAGGGAAGGGACPIPLKPRRCSGALVRGWLESQAPSLENCCVTSPRGGARRGWAPADAKTDEGESAARRAQRAEGAQDRGGRWRMPVSEDSQSEDEPKPKPRRSRRRKPVVDEDPGEGSQGEGRARLPLSAAGGPRRRRAPGARPSLSTISAPVSLTPLRRSLAVAPAHLAAPEGVALAPGPRGISSAGVVSQASRLSSSAPQQLIPDRSAPLPRSASEVGRLAQLRRELVGAGRHVQADPDDRPALLGTSLDEDAGELAAVGPDVVRPLDPAFDARHRLTRLTDRHGHRQRQESLLAEVADHEGTSGSPGRAAPPRSGPAGRGRRTGRPRSRAVPCGAPAAASCPRAPRWSSPCPGGGPRGRPIIAL